MRIRPLDNLTLRQALISPEVLRSLEILDWDYLLQASRAAGLLAHIDVLLADMNLFEAIPARVKPHLIAARLVAENEARILRWEVDRLSCALESLGCPVILLKGAAYSLLGLAMSKGRISSDVDILVPKTEIGAVEQRLLHYGWAHVKLNDYDQFYYRHWSHELPPLQHRDRGTVVDVHHTILPPVGRLHPDPEKLLAVSLPLAGTRFRVLAPADMVLHSAAHGFQDGDLKRGLRDLVDIDGLLRQFGQDEKFWQELGGRAQELGLTRPLYYAVRYAQRHLETPIAPALLEQSKRWRPVWLALAVMDKVVDQVVTAGPWRQDVGLKLSQQLLYIRSHWLRMPPHLLIPHLIRKALKKK